MTKWLGLASLPVAVAALVLAVWPVVGDAPWEDTLVAVAQPTKEMTLCQSLWNQLATAQTEVGAKALTIKLSNESC